MGAKVDQTTVWATPAAMKRLIPLPSPQFFWSISSRSMITIPANTSCKSMRNWFWIDGRVPLTL